MGAVYKARQKSLNRLVAIKILAPERVGEGRFAERFTIEAELLAKLGHPHIVTIHDFGETGGLFYLVMEFIDGVNLRDLLRDGKMEPEQALAIVPPICDALQYAHDKGIVHRDIKPENILLDRDGRVKIADFGIASLVGASGENSGTPPYMAPEQSGGTVDRRADIYALGVVLYEMLTGERPTKELVAPSKRVEVSVKIDEMVLRALEKEPERRYQTAGEFRTIAETIAATPSEPKRDETRFAGERRQEGKGRVLLAQIETWAARYGWLSVIAIGLGLLIILGAIANFNFTLGVGKAPMMMVGSIFVAGGIIGAAIGSGRKRSLEAVDSASGDQGDLRMQNKRPESPAMSPGNPRFSRTAVAGAIWAGLACIGLVYVSVGVIVFGLRWWQGLPTMVFMPVVLTAPMGVTILGWVAVSQIRRACGRLRGHGLAVFDGLLFPLLLLTGLIAWFWYWVFYGVIRDSIIAEGGELPLIQKLLVSNAAAFTVLATSLTSLVAAFFITRNVWRAVTNSSQNPSVDSPARGSGKTFNWRLGLALGLVLAAAIIGPRLVNDYLVRRAGAPIPEQLARQAISPLLEAESLRWETMRFEPNTVSPSDVIVRFTKLERVGTLHGQAVVKPLDGILNLRTLDGILWRADGLEDLRGIQFNFRLDDTPDLPGKSVEPIIVPDRIEYSFTHVIERFIGDPDATADRTGPFLNLDTGDVLDPRKHIPKSMADYSAVESWIKEKQVDLSVLISREKGKLIDGQLSKFDLLSVPVPSTMWDSGTAAEVLALVTGKLNWVTSLTIPVYGKPSEFATYVFKTREGGIGILKVDRFSDSPKGLKVLYKLVQTKVTPQYNPPRGEPAGLQVSLKAGEKSVWRPDEIPEFALSVRNTGTNLFSLIQSQPAIGWLLLDGDWYGWSGVSEGKASWLMPEKSFGPFPVTLGRDWTSLSTQKPLHLAPGEHTLRIAVHATIPDPSTGSFRNSSLGSLRQIRSVSEPVRFTIAAKEEKSGTVVSAFGPVVERVVTQQIDLDSDNLMRPEQEGTDYKADALYEDPVFRFTDYTERIQLIADDWDAMSPEQLQTFLNKRVIPAQPDFNKNNTRLPITLGIRTSSGRMGILQIIGFTDNPRGVKIRYKLATQQKADAPLRITGPAKVSEAKMRSWVENQWKSQYPNETFEPLSWGEPATVAPQDWVTIRCKFRWTAPWAGGGVALDVHCAGLGRILDGIAAGQQRRQAGARRRDRHVGAGGVSSCGGVEDAVADLDCVALVQVGEHERERDLCGGRPLAVQAHRQKVEQHLDAHGRHHVP